MKDVNKVKTNTADADSAAVNRNYKDTVFRMLFRENENLLSLYNALNGTFYTDIDSLEITTLENAVYMNYKNDISFVLDSELMIYEHQSTVNPNMPLRDLKYGRSESESRTYTAELLSEFRRQNLSFSITEPISNRKNRP